MTLANPNELSALDALKEMQAGSLSSEELVLSCLDRIREREKTIGAWQFIEPEQALDDAQVLDKNNENLPLFGIPVGVKDIFNTSTMPTTYGSQIYQGHRPVADASSVTRIRDTGGIVLGKTVTTEFAFFEPGKTANPINPNHTPGGSSSGSAAAVADFMVPLALGSQTVGSTIRPASYCGVIGYKPSFGLIDRTGVRALAESFDTVGIFARTIGDAAYFGSLLSRRPSIFSPHTENFRPRFGMCKTPEWQYAEEDTKKAIETAASIIDSCNGDIREIRLPSPFDELSRAQSVIADYESANSALYELIYHKEKVSIKYRERAESGLSYSEKEYDDACEIILGAQSLAPKIFANIDVILCPSAPGEAPKGLGATGDPIFNRIGTALKGPCLNIPGLTGHSGLPVGVQIIGEFKDDKNTLQSGQWLHQMLQAH